MKSVNKSGISIMRFIYDHMWLLALMKAFTNGRASVHLALTRFATHFIAADSLVLYRNELILMFISEPWVNSNWGKATCCHGFDVPNLVRDNKF